MELQQFPIIAHHRAARCVVARSGVCTPCAHYAKVRRGQCHKCQLKFHFNGYWMYITLHRCAIKHLQIQCDFIHIENCKLLRNVPLFFAACYGHLCQNEECLVGQWMNVTCNDVRDCEDWSDELGCPTSEFQFYSNCIDIALQRFRCVYEIIPFLVHTK